MELLEYVHIIRKRLWVIIIPTVVFAIVSAIISYYFLEPQYQANATLYVANKRTNGNMLTYTDLTAGGIIAKDYQQLLKSRLVCEAVIADLGLTNITPQRLSSKINIELKNETRFLSIKVLDYDPKLAASIANSVANTFKEKAEGLLNIENIHIVDSALEPKNPSKPDEMLNIMIAAFVGLMLGLGIVFIWEYLDDTIKVPDDVTKHLQLPILGAIPEHVDSLIP